MLNIEKNINDCIENQNIALKNLCEIKGVPEEAVDKGVETSEIFVRGFLSAYLSVGFISEKEMNKNYDYAVSLLRNTKLLFFEGER